MPVLARSHPLPSSRIVHDTALAPPFPSQNDRGYINLYVATYPASDFTLFSSQFPVIDSVRGWMALVIELLLRETQSEIGETLAENFCPKFVRFSFFFFSSRFYAVSILK